MAQTQAEIFLAALTDAYLNLCSGVQQYTWNSGGTSRTFTRADIEKIRKEMQYWQGVVDRQNGVSRRVKYFVPRDDSNRIGQVFPAF